MWLTVLKQQIYSWWWIHFWWLCLHVTDIQWWPLVARLIFPYKHACKQNNCNVQYLIITKYVDVLFIMVLWELPYMYDRIFVLIVCRPYRYFVSFRSHVDDGTADVIAVVIECFSHKAQKLKTNAIFRTCQHCINSLPEVVKEIVDSPSPTRSGPDPLCAAVWKGWSASGRPVCFSRPPTWAQCHPAPKTVRSSQKSLMNNVVTQLSPASPWKGNSHILTSSYLITECDCITWEQEIRFCQIFHLCEKWTFVMG